MSYTQDEEQVINIDGTDVIVGLTSEEWLPTNATKYYAQILPMGIYAFGSTKEEALENLRKEADF